MDLRVLFPLVFLALSCAQGEHQVHHQIAHIIAKGNVIVRKIRSTDVSESCSKNDVQRCLTLMQPLLDINLDEDKTCEITRSTYNCLKEKADLCLRGYSRELIQPKLDQLQLDLSKACNNKRLLTHINQAADNKNEIVHVIEGQSAAENECHPDNVQHCLTMIRPVLNLNTKKETACKAIRSTYDCLKDKADICLNGIGREYVQPELDKLKTHLDTNCNGQMDDDTSIAMKCLAEHVEYFRGCSSYEKIVEFIRNTRSGTYMCPVYVSISGCMVTRAEEKCGEHAVKFMADNTNQILEKEGCLTSQHMIGRRMTRNRFARSVSSEDFLKFLN